MVLQAIRMSILEQQEQLQRQTQTEMASGLTGL